MRILVTGAGGFVGTHLVHGLCKSFPQAKVIAADRAIPSPSVAAYWSPFANRIEGALLDIAVGNDVDRFVVEAKPSHVVHAAALTPTLDEEKAAPQAIVGVNVEGTTAIVDAATRLTGMRRIIFVSSGAVYGREQALPDRVDETIPALPDMLYGVTKLAAEGITARLGEIRGVSTASVRLASVYGEMERATPSRHRTSLIHRLIHSDGPVTVSGEDVVRDWVHADDVALAVARLLTDGPINSQLFHIGGDEAVGWRRIVDFFRRSGWPIAYAPISDAADIRVSAADARPVFSTARIAGRTGFKPRSIEEGLAGLVEQVKVSR